MKLFKTSIVLRKLFFIELILIFSFASSFGILAFVKLSAPPEPIIAPPVSYDNLLGNYNTLFYFLNLPETLFTRKEEVKNIHFIPAKPYNPKDRLLLTIQAINTADQFLKEKKYKRVTTTIDRLIDPHPFLDEKKNQLYLKGLYFQHRFKTFLKVYDTTSHGNNLQIELLAINSLLKTGNEERAFALFRKLFLHNRLSPFKSYLGSTTLKKFTKKLSYDDWFNKFKYLAEKNHYSEFLRERRYINAPQLNNLFFAEFNYKRRRYSRVIKHLTKVKSDQLLPIKKKLLLKIQVRRKHYGDLFKKLEELEKDRALYNELLFDVGSILLIHRQLDLSAECFSRFIKNTEEEFHWNNAVNSHKKPQQIPSKLPSKYWKGLWLYAWIHYRMDEMDTAETYFKKGIRSPEDSYKMANLYWYHRLQDTTPQNLQNYPFSYYYTKTENAKKGLILGSLKGFTQLINDGQGELFQQYIGDLKSLLENGYIDEGFSFTRWAKVDKQLSASEQNVFKLIESILYLKQGRFYHAFVSFRRNFDNYQQLRLPRFLNGIYSPVRYKSLVETYCNRQDLDIDLVLSLIRQESFFRPHIVSPARANGLMQLLYSTARIMAKRQGIRIRKHDLYTPETNIRLGTEYLRFLMDRYDGKYHLVLAAYNAGESRVDRWLRNFGDVPEDVFVEMIPFTETRNYVKHIMRNYYYYKFYHGRPTNQT